MKTTEITSHEIACMFLERDPKALPDVSMRPVQQQNAILAFAKLLDIAEAINKADNFEADFNDFDQRKWYPIFDGSEGFAFSYSGYDDWRTGTTVGSRLCFSSEKISDFFGTQFIDLHQEILIIKK